MSAALPQCFDYVLFGLRLRSSIALPELSAATPGPAPDIVIDHGDVPGEVEADGRPHPVEGGAVLAFEGVARYAITGGSRIIVQPEPGADERNVRLFLLGSAMGMLLHQRGLLPLHANAVEIDGKAVAFMGPSGAGKSTLAAWFEGRGHGIIADDVCVVTFDHAGLPLATPGLPRFRLWRAAMTMLGKDHGAFERSFAGDEQYDKYDVPVPVGSAVDTALPLAAVYLLGTGETFSVERLTGVAAAETIFANTYRGAFVGMAKEPHDHWHACLRLITRSTVFRVDRRWDLERMDEQNEAIVAHARQLLASMRGD